MSRTIIFSLILLSLSFASCPCFAITEPVASKSAVAVADIDGLARAANGETVTLTLSGTITAASNTGVVLDDGSKKIWLYLNPVRDFTLRSGDTVTLHCEACYEAEKDTLSVTAVAAPSVAHDSDEIPAERAELIDVISGKALFKSVALTGVITDVFRDEIDPEWIFIILESKNSRATFTLPDRNNLQLKDIAAFVNRSVEITGICKPPAGGRRNIGNTVIIDKPACIQPVAASSDNPFVYPFRRSVAGTVIAAWGHRSLFLRDGTGKALRVKLAADVQSPPIGSHVTVCGFLRQNVFFDIYANATVKLDSESLTPPEPPTELTARDILYDGNGLLRIRPDADGRIIRLRGVVKDIARPGTDDGRLLLNCDGVLVPAEIGKLAPPPLGSKISVSGACLMTYDSDETSGGFVRLNGLSIIPRSPEDIRLLAPPPWWTPGRFVCVIGALLAAMVGIFIWNRALQHIVERRGRQLLRAQIEGERSALRIDERTRLAVELHDSLSQNLTGVSFQLDAFRCAREVDADAAERHLETAEHILNSCRTELRRCLWDLHSDALEETDFAQAVRKVLQPFDGKTRISIRFNVPRSRMDDTTAHAILRIIRELTANAIVHGKARHVRIAGDFKDGHTIFSVTDDGCGFDQTACPGPNTGHFGIMGIRERVTGMHGTFNLTSSEDSGTKIRIDLPSDKKSKDIQL